MIPVRVSRLQHRRDLPKTGLARDFDQAQGGGIFHVGMRVVLHSLQDHWERFGRIVRAQRFQPFHPNLRVLCTQHIAEYRHCR